MATSSSLGSLAGVNLDSLMATIQRQQGGRAANLAQQEKSYSAKLSGYGKVINALSSLKSAAAGLGKAGLFDPVGDDPITAKPDAAKIKAAVKSFVDSYNATQKVVSGLSAYDKDAKTGAALFGDKALGDVQTQLRKAFSDTSGGSLADMGLSFDNDGTLTLDDAKLDAAIQSNPGGVRQFFVGDDGKSGLSGRMSALTTTLTGKDSPLTQAFGQASDMLTMLGHSQDDESDRVTALMASYRAQFQRLSLLYNDMGVASAFMSDQLAVLKG
ncbi:flagellar filament capping protein FliD [Cupriavidus pampae]|uniref:Filament cap protein n=1 Tax=Cupriavidus pampae TaxID=659251 RepID=A0ABN7YFU4_9BURK|nr:flagellar filament capping protein FliD [Cupriavidus pampae]CAG9171082.1 hypothetical protein LMG32289_02247 [Cupriavidus pampae]